MSTPTLPKPWMHDLWSHLHNEHGLTLVESEISEIVRLAAPEWQPIETAPKDGVTRAKNPFVYEATAEGYCELYTPENSGVKTKPCDCKQCVKYRGFSIRSKLLGRLKHAASIFLSELREAAGPTEAISKFQKLVQQDDEKTIIQWGRHALSKESGLKLPPIYTESEWAKWCNTPCSTGA